MYNKTINLPSMPYANACVYKYDNGGLKLISYSTAVIIVDGNNFATCTGLYSATTRRHISAFAKDFTNLNYYDFKAIANTNKKVNIYTGEVIG